MPLPLYCSPKHSGALLGSNSMRNTIAIATSMRQRHLFDPAFFMLRAYLYAKKNGSADRWGWYKDKNPQIQE